jgi:phage repressor protein C with HTH and peptisase S24 domain
MNSNLLSERLRWAIERKLAGSPDLKKIPQSQIAKAAGVSPSAAGYWFADANGINAEQARKVGDFLGVDPIWLEKGEGSALPIESVLEMFPGSRRVVAVDDDSSDTYRIPFVKLKLRAGMTGFQAEPEMADGGTIGLAKTWVDRRGFTPSQLISMEVKGESMEPTFYEGDTIVINLADKKPTDNGVFAVNYDGESVVKRLSRDAGQWWLMSDNADQRRFYRRQCRGTECIIIGRVVRREGDHF